MPFGLLGSASIFLFLGATVPFAWTYIWPRRVVSPARFLLATVAIGLCSALVLYTWYLQPLFDVRHPGEPPPGYQSWSQFQAGLLRRYVAGATVLASLQVIICALRQHFLRVNLTRAYGPVISGATGMKIPLGVEGSVLNSSHARHVVRVEENEDGAGGFLIYQRWEGSNGQNAHGEFSDWVESEQELQRYFVESGWKVEWTITVHQSRSWFWPIFLVVWSATSAKALPLQAAVVAVCGGLAGVVWSQVVAGMRSVSLLLTSGKVEVTWRTKALSPRRAEFPLGEFGCVVSYTVQGMKPTTRVELMTVSGTYYLLLAAYPAAAKSFWSTTYDAEPAEAQTLRVSVARTCGLTDGGFVGNRSPRAQLL